MDTNEKRPGFIYLKEINMKIGKTYIFPLR
jgi:hypothetical protein